MRFQSLLHYSRWVLMILVLTGGQSAFSQQDMDPGAAGRSLAAELRTQHPPEGEWKGRIKFRSHDRKTLTTIPVLGKVSWNGPAWSNVYLTSAVDGLAAEQLTIMHSADGPNEYLLAKAPVPGAALGEARKLTGPQADIPLAHSDFWLSDLGFEFYQWPKQVKRPSEMKRSRACYVLESFNPILVKMAIRAWSPGSISTASNSIRAASFRPRPTIRTINYTRNSPSAISER